MQLLKAYCAVATAFLLTHHFASAASINLRNAASLRQCLSNAVGGDDMLVQFSDEVDFLDKDLKPFNLNLQYAPFSISYPKTVEQVADTVVCAQTHNKKVQARSGGRDFINKCIGGSDGHVIVDLQAFNKVEVDPNTHMASIGPGNLLGDLVRGLHQDGRFIPHGSSRSVGVGGHLMVGGMGYTSRQYGMSIDTIQEIQVVLGNGTIVSATSSSHPELLWAMRGAGASFGIATEFKVQTEIEPAAVVEFSYTYESDDSKLLRNALKSYFELVRDEDLSLKLGGTLRFTNTSLVFSGGFFGSEEEFYGLNLTTRLPNTSSVSVLPNLSWATFMDDILRSGGSTNNPAFFAIEDSVFTRPLLPTTQILDEFVDYIYSPRAELAQWSFLFDLYGGAMGDVSPSATAFPHRDALVCLTAYARTENTTSQTTVSTLEEAVLILQGDNPDQFGAYSGVPSLSLGTKAQQKYWGVNLARLEKVKAMYDPNDIFSTCDVRVWV